ncbi:MAG: hypothetical protein ABWX61_04975 [Paenisporosarcina sp.]
MREGKWEVYVVLALIVYSILLFFLFGSSPVLITQINSIVIIGLLIAILLKLNNKSS